MSKLKNENELLQKAIEVAENYANQRGFDRFSKTDSAKDKVEVLYRLLVRDNLIQPLPVDQETQPKMKHKLALWISRQLPDDHPLLK
ncbi:MAG: DUF5062 family protein [Gammaproteobacteria bacterium]|nr:DUF5062 family protein [Gammaproteobacteria bacterium]